MGVSRGVFAGLSTVRLHNFNIVRETFVFNAASDPPRGTSRKFAYMPTVVTPVCVTIQKNYTHEVKLLGGH